MLLVALLFVAGYAFIALERTLRIDKSATALLLGCLLWVLLALGGLGGRELLGRLTEHLADIAALVFFLMGAMTIVEVIDAHGGFSIITSRVRTERIRTLLWIVAGLTFVLSAVLDNLTTTIVMLTLTRKLVGRDDHRLVFAGVVVIAANAGGAFSPIGDVTTTMLWIGGQISPGRIVARLFVPSLVNLLLPLAVATFWLKGDAGTPAAAANGSPVSRRERTLVFFLGIGLIIAVPLFKIATGLPPYMGILLALGILWITTELLHRRKSEPERRGLSLGEALLEIDLPSIMFFVGILLAVAALEVVGALAQLGAWLDARVGNQSIIVFILGLASSVIDNVPLVSAAMNMYDLARFPTDHFVWEFLAFCAGTGGSLLIIGSAAGVTAMGMEPISFGWYARRFAPLALLGYAGGAITYLLELHII